MRKKISGYSIVENDLQFFICGVEGSGRKSFLSVFFPCEKTTLREFCVDPYVKRILVIVILDGLHQHNIEEEQMLINVARLYAERKDRDMSILFVLNKLDLLNEKPKSENVMLMHKSYCSFIQIFNIPSKYFYFFSANTSLFFREILHKEFDELNYLKAQQLLLRIGRNRTVSFSVKKMLRYLKMNHKIFLTISGEYPILNLITQWRKEKL